jgi:hypothetical protein
LRSIFGAIIVFYKKIYEEPEPDNEVITIEDLLPNKKLKELIDQTATENPQAMQQTQVFVPHSFHK